MATISLASAFARSSPIGIASQSVGLAGSEAAADAAGGVPVLVFVGLLGGDGGGDAGGGVSAAATGASVVSAGAGGVAASAVTTLADEGSAVRCIAGSDSCANHVPNAAADMTTIATVLTKTGLFAREGAAARGWDLLGSPVIR